MLVIGLLYFALVFWALVLWGSIYIVERANPYNRFGMAFVMSAGNIALSFMLSMLPMGDVIYLVAALSLLLRMLMLFYQLGILRALAAAAITVGAPFVILPKFGEWVGFDLMRLYALCFGFPTAVIVAWVALRMRKPRYAEAGADEPIPQARVEKLQRQPKRADTAPAPVVRPSRPVVAPAPAAPREPGSEPTLLT